MARLGWYLFVFGLGSAALHFLEREFVVLMWIEAWGDGAAWAIRAAMIAAGVLLMVAAQPPVHERAPASSPLVR